MTDAPTLYDQDFVAWTQEQAAALRAAAHSGTNQALDWANLAEEVEDLGKSVRRELRNQTTRIMHHLLKLQHSPATEPRRGWRNSAREARTQIAALLRENPSLQSDLARLVAEELPDAINLAIADLDDYGELNSVNRVQLVGASYSADQILGDWFPPEPSPARE
jgi:hypothetical protein